MDEQLQKIIYDFIKNNPQSNLRHIADGISKNPIYEISGIVRQIKQMINDEYLISDDDPISGTSRIRIRRKADYKFSFSNHWEQFILDHFHEEPIGFAALILAFISIIVSLLVAIFKN